LIYGLKELVADNLEESMIFFIQSLGIATETQLQEGKTSQSIPCRIAVAFARQTPEVLCEPDIVAWVQQQLSLDDAMLELVYTLAQLTLQLRDTYEQHKSDLSLITGWPSWLQTLGVCQPAETLKEGQGALLGFVDCGGCRRPIFYSSGTKGFSDEQLQVVNEQLEHLDGESAQPSEGISEEQVKELLDKVLLLTNQMALGIKPVYFGTIKTVLLETLALVSGGPIVTHLPAIAESSQLFNPEQRQKIRQFATLLSFFSTSIDDIMSAAKSHIAAEEDPTDLGGLFQKLINISGRPGLDFDDFVEATKHLSLQVSTEKRLQIFVKCDAGLKGYLERDEFLDAMTQVERDLATDVMFQMGLSDAHMYSTLATIAICLGAFIIFLLCAISAFTTGSEFEAVINSMFIGFGTFAAGAGENEVEAEDDLDHSVKSVIEMWGGDTDIQQI